MKYIEVSRKIDLRHATDAQALKTRLVASLERMMEIDSTGEGVESFRVSGSTGAPGAFMRHTQLDLDVGIAVDGDVARVVVSGYARPARSLSVVYWIMFFIVLLVGLLPGAVETRGDTSDSMDVLVLLIFGIFIVTDVNKKLIEPRDSLQDALASLDTIYG